MQAAKQYIEKSRNDLMASTQGLTEAQWNFQPSPECWSIAGIVEHVVATQDLVLGPIRERLSNAPPAPANHPPEEVDALILKTFPDRSVKFKGPEILHPTGRWTPAEALARFGENCRHFEEYVESTPDLRQHAVDSMPLKALSGGAYQVMDGYQWAIGIAAHTERHTRQILEVQSDARFPARETSRASA